MGKTDSQSISISDLSELIPFCKNAFKLFIESGGMIRIVLLENVNRSISMFQSNKSLTD